MDEIRKQLIAALRGGQVYDRVEQLLGEVPAEKRFVVPTGMEHSAWQILDHMRITLEDLVAYSTTFDGQYQEIKWPDDYWPTDPEGDWHASKAGLEKIQAKLENVATDGDLTNPFPWEPSHNLLRQILLAIEHNAYHSGELVELTRVLKR